MRGSCEIHATNWATIRNVPVEESKAETEEVEETTAVTEEEDETSAVIEEADVNQIEATTEVAGQIERVDLKADTTGRKENLREDTKVTS